VQRSRSLSLAEISEKLTALLSIRSRDGASSGYAEGHNPKTSLQIAPEEDPDSIQVGIRKLQAAIIDGKLDSKQIGHLAYTIQLAAWNVMRTTTVQAE
jgi:hypothetical protein